MTKVHRSHKDASKCCLFSEFNNNKLKTVFMVLWSWQNHCRGSASSSDECRM